MRGRDAFFGIGFQFLARIRAAGRHGRNRLAEKSKIAVNCGWLSYLLCATLRLSIQVVLRNFTARHALLLLPIRSMRRRILLGDAAKLGHGFFNPPAIRRQRNCTRYATAIVLFAEVPTDNANHLRAVGLGLENG